MILYQRHVSLLTAGGQCHRMLLHEQSHKVRKRDLALNRVDLLVDFPHDLVTQPLGLALRDLAAIAKSMPNLLPFELILSDQHLSPVSDIPIGPRAFLPQHRWHLKLTSCHPFSFGWLGVDRLGKQRSTLRSVANTRARP